MWWLQQRGLTLVGSEAVLGECGAEGGLSLSLAKSLPPDRCFCCCWTGLHYAWAACAWDPPHKTWSSNHVHPTRLS